jgi:hypothetical protein
VNSIEIEQAISDLADQPFEVLEFPYAFLRAFGNKETTLKRLKSGNENKSDVQNGVLQRNNIHLAVCNAGETSATLHALRTSAATAKYKAKFILATDGIDFEAEDVITGDVIACDYADFPNHFGFFLPLAGISTVQQIRESSFDIRATSRLNRLYVELLKLNPDWANAERRHDMNHFMARLIFCFFAEDTDIFNGEHLFTKTIEQMTDKDGSNTASVMSEIFRAMNIKPEHRSVANLRPWADAFPYVNGGLFGDSIAAPNFSNIARTYLIKVGQLDWKKINPDIFGSMIQAVADDDERGSLGMHYTSVPNILKVLNPLFLDDIRAQLAAAGDNARKLLNLRKRLAHIRVFDPACGSGNFLVIAYKELRAIEADINQRRQEPSLKSVIPLTNFRGIEIKDFSAEIARLALIIAEYQCDVTYIGQKEALLAFLPLDNQNWITAGNALRLDWLTICPPTGTGVKLLGDDLFNTPLDQAEIDFENEGGETYICGNPPYLGSTWQNAEQKEELKAIFGKRCKNYKSLDYVAAWFMKAADYGKHTPTVSAFVSTNSICQGSQVPILWPLIFETGHAIAFAHTSFKWRNLASHNAGVTVAIVAIAANLKAPRRLFSASGNELTLEKQCKHINAYLVDAPNVIVEKRSKPWGGLSEMSFGNKPVDGGNLLLNRDEVDDLGLSSAQQARFIRRIVGSAELIKGLQRYCLWINDAHLEEANDIQKIKQRIDNVREIRLASSDKSANEMAERAHQFREMNTATNHTIVVPRVSSETRAYLPVGLEDNQTIIGDSAFALYDAPLWHMALIASRLHLVWIATVCGKLKTDFRYSNTMGWNTFPAPKLTEQNRRDLTACAENILLAREAHFPATIADLYAEGAMPDNLRHAHTYNDEVVERIYIGRLFKNDTERLEKLFDMYTKMATQVPKKTER